MPFNHPRALRAALGLLAAGTSLAGAAPAAGQNLQAPVLRNEAEVMRHSAAAYPAALRDSAISGDVILKFRVRVDSTVDPASITVVQATNPAFVEPAVSVALEMRFAPARSGGAPVAAWTRFPVQFRIGTPPPARPEPVEGNFNMSAVEEPPRLRNSGDVARQIAARYPPALRDAGVPGDVVVRFRLLENGTVDPASVVAVASTDLAFEEPAVAIVRQMRFTPGKVNNRPVRVWIEIPIHYSVTLPPAERQPD
jgi:TonB family protein